MFVLACGFALAGCNGQVYHQAVDVGEADGAPGKKRPGIIYYPRVQMLKTTIAVAADCSKTTTSDIVTVPDTFHPQRLVYEPGLLETYKFGPTLSADGTLMGLNTESTPDQGNTFKNVASGVASLAGAAVSAGFTGQSPAEKSQLSASEHNTPTRTAAAPKCAAQTTVDLSRLTTLDTIHVVTGR